MDLGRIARTEKGRWKRAPLSSPVAVLKTDVVEVEDGKAWILRNGHYVDSRDINFAAKTDLTLVPMSEPHTLTEVYFWERDPMPSVSATITNSTINQSTGLVRINFSSGDQREFSDFAALQAVAEGIDSSVEMAQDLAILALVRRSPDGSNLDVCNGMCVTIDGAASQPVSYSGLPQV